MLVCWETATRCITLGGIALTDFLRGVGENRVIWRRGVDLTEPGSSISISTQHLSGNRGGRHITPNDLRAHRAKRVHLLCSSISYGKPLNIILRMKKYRGRNKPRRKSTVIMTREPGGERQEPKNGPGTKETAWRRGTHRYNINYRARTFINASLGEPTDTERRETSERWEEFKIQRREEGRGRGS